MAEIIKVIADVIQAEMELPNSRVYLYNQKWTIPPDQDIFIVVGFIGAKPFGARCAYENDPVTNELVEVQSVNQQETYSIDVISRNSSARQRKQEVILALNSTLMQQKMEEHNFKLGNLPISFVDASEVEAAALLNRYRLAFNALVIYRKTKSTEYYDSFSVPPDIITNP